jgi:hypothetical protein
MSTASATSATMSSTDSKSSSSNSSSSISPLAIPFGTLPLGSFLETFEAGPVEPFFAWVFLAEALALPDLAAGAAFEVLDAGFTLLEAALVLLAAFAAGLVVFDDFVVADLVSAFLDFGALFAPAVRVAFFGAAGAFAT